MAPKRKQTAGAAIAPSLWRSPRQHTGTLPPPETVQPKQPKKKKSKTDASTSSAAEETSAPTETGNGMKTIIIEHCKQCTSFKTRAERVKTGLEKDVPGVNVVVNPEKPRRGCFEIREEVGEIFLSLLDMKRPFKPMKDLVMEDVISDIVGKIS